jgi:glycosyltransferase involved in cell wall biosynthesis
MNSGTVIVVGVGPLPVGNPERIYAPGLRLFAFSQTIHRAGFRVLMGEADFNPPQADKLRIANCELRITSSSQVKDPHWIADKPIESPTPNGFVAVAWERRPLPLDPHVAAKTIAAWIEQEKPIAIVSTTDVMNLASALAVGATPRWIDYNGHPMAERQEIAFIHGSDAGLADQWHYVLPALLAGDHFSVCSTPQKYALIGELGAVGRLNRQTSGCELVTIIPPGIVHHEQEPDGRVAFRGSKVPSDAFCLLFTGGYNTWVDEQTLFKGIELAIEKESEDGVKKQIHFISTGGEIKGHNEVTFKRFRTLVNASPFAERFHFFGWVPLDDLPNFYSEADAAINCDRFTYEGMLGMRNRILSWVLFGIPVITTPLCEFARNLVSRDFAVGFPEGDANALCDCILKMAKNQGYYKEKAVSAKGYILEEYRYEKFLKPLIDWLDRPRISPDRLRLSATGGKKDNQDNPLIQENLIRLRQTEAGAPILWTSPFQAIIRFLKTYR